MLWRKITRAPRPKCPAEPLQTPDPAESSSPDDSSEELSPGDDDEGYFQRRHQLFAELAKASKLPVALEVAEGRVPASRHQGDLQFYTPEMLGARQALRSNPNVLAALHGMWRVVPKKLHFLVDRAIYFEVYAKLYRQLVPNRPAGAISCSLAQDWEHDRQGSQVLSMEMFFDSMFDLTDMWCDTVTEEEYVHFIECCTAVLLQPDSPPAGKALAQGRRGPEGGRPPPGLLDAWRNRRLRDPPPPALEPLSGDAVEEEEEGEEGEGTPTVEAGAGLEGGDGAVGNPVVPLLLQDFSPPMSPTLSSQRSVRTDIDRPPRLRPPSSSRRSTEPSPVLSPKSRSRPTLGSRRTRSLPQDINTAAPSPVGRLSGKPCVPALGSPAPGLPPNVAGPKLCLGGLSLPSRPPADPWGPAVLCLGGTPRVPPVGPEGPARRDLNRLSRIRQPDPFLTGFGQALKIHPKAAQWRQG
eukprot:EG_transcript_6872